MDSSYLPNMQFFSRLLTFWFSQHEFQRSRCFQRRHSYHIVFTIRLGHNIHGCNLVLRLLQGKKTPYTFRYASDKSVQCRTPVRSNIWPVHVAVRCCTGKHTRVIAYSSQRKMFRWRVFYRRLFPSVVFHQCNKVWLGAMWRKTVPYLHETNRSINQFNVAYIPDIRSACDILSTTGARCPYHIPTWRGGSTIYISRFFAFCSNMHLCQLGYLFPPKEGQHTARFLQPWIEQQANSGEKPSSIGQKHSNDRAHSGDVVRMSFTIPWRRCNGHVYRSAVAECEGLRARHDAVRSFY